MYSITQYNGSELPHKTLCLTYDDGPGKDTYQIAEFLHQLKIRATFFVVGKYAYHNPEILKALKDLGHIIGNHTYDHPDLPYYVSISGNVQDQVLRTDAIIRQLTDDDIVYFRPPYGKWSKEVADDLNSNPLVSLNHVGPIHWEVDGVDCYYWRNDFSVSDTVDKYLLEINKKKNRGIVVMHDDISDMDHIRQKNQTLQLTKTLIPILLKQGYKFVGLDEIPAIKTAAESVTDFHVYNSEGKLLSLTSADNTELSFDYNTNKTLSNFNLAQPGFGKVALKATSNMFLNSGNTNQEIIADSQSAKDYELFDWIPVTDNKVILRSFTGNYLKSINGKLTASAEYMRQAEEFSFVPLNYGVKREVSLLERILLKKKKMQFIKSKISQKISKRR